MVDFTVTFSQQLSIKEKKIHLSHSSKSFIANEVTILNADVAKRKKNLNETNYQYMTSGVENDVTEHDLKLEVSESQTKNLDSHNPLLVENSEVITMLAGYIVYRVKKKSLSTVFNYGNPTSELSTLNKD